MFSAMPTARQEHAVHYPSDEQPGVSIEQTQIDDSPEAALDPNYGVRWVDYKTLTDLKNYGQPNLLLDQRISYKTQGLEVPYAFEYTLGYTRNYDTGSIRIDLSDIL